MSTIDVSGDRALLEAAARAAGIVLYVKKHEDEPVPPECVARVWDKPGQPLTILFYSDAREHPMCRRNQPHGNIEWNPLTDDGDALRLAVKLGLEIKVTPVGALVVPHEGGEVCPEWKDSDKNGNCHTAATRRAITRAAAALAASLPA